MAKNKKAEKVLTVNRSDSLKLVKRKDRLRAEKQAQVIRDALEKRTQKEGVDKDWFDKHVIVEVV